MKILLTVLSEGDFPISIIKEKIVWWRPDPLNEKQTIIETVTGRLWVAATYEEISACLR
jgi:hypothetical protein